MTTVTAFNKSNLPTIRADINVALAAVAKKYGIQMDIGNISFTETSFSTKLNVGIASQMNKLTQVAVPKMPGTVALHNAFRNNAYTLGYKPEDLFKTVEYRGQSYVLCGARPRARNKIVLARADGSMIAVLDGLVKVK